VFAVGSAADPALGGNALQAVVAVDATVTASAAGTLPASDTMPTERGASPTGVTPAAFAFIAIALGSFAIASIASARRMRQD
jgi:hypothetical protein